MTVVSVLAKHMIAKNVSGLHVKREQLVLVVTVVMLRADMAVKCVVLGRV